MRTVVIDNEPEIVALLLELIGQYLPQLQVVGTANGVAEAAMLIAKEKPGLVFLDVEMDDGTGFDLLQRLPQRDFQVIFVTAHSKYAIQAIKMNALDYLLKPVSVSDLTEAVEKVLSKMKSSAPQPTVQHLIDFLSASNQSRKIVLRSAESIHIVNVADIVWCAAEGSYTSFRVVGEPDLLISGHLKEYERLLEDYKFYRPHNSYLLNLQHVKRFDKADGGKIVMSDDSVLPVSTRKKEQLIQLITSIH
ncbi:LytTR family DNA-binding domain-containing protein [Imperialibacter roseus]|uniref:LytTR family DNA-binding domain-containing protein n=1 Tax=Imperialibacter roseus TaxID=1324217 RepID=A0ABZ0INF8_9BACT|nr:LytTR family DNA-binding domain-containing protein [Imperialibacter roseus]WOK05241.1 LytTR family DNA-binding domain-containing protein [Imperialibacter roseus]